ncbi:unnamed protein product [Rotaria sordida]|uniref:Mucoidy inhibitor A n=1 Tax=Rotaria sordida TaxID=392033 RepID=A0A815JQV4_9BILA|nr:unnamed protein product [Rotaria sordida]CAF1384718.1 unnamed protein product [Rotaria sordida]
MAETILTTNTPPSATIVHINIKQECPVQFVTVYNDRAELTRLLRYHFDNEGTYDLVLQGLSPCIDLTSFRVSGGTGKACTILEVSYQKRYEDPSTSLSDTTPLDQLQTQLDIVQADIDEHAQELDRLKKQRTWLDGRASKLMNQEGPLSTSDLETMEQFLNFYHKMLSKIDKETTQEQRQLKELNSRCDALTVKINEHGSQAMINRRIEQREVTITIHVASSKTDVALEVSYLISNCSWSASYDIRVDSGEGRQPKTQLTYYGIIINKSQENWSDTQFSLSTATPSLGGSAPKLATLKVNNRQYHGVPQRFMSSAAQSMLSMGGSMSRASKELSHVRERTSLTSSADSYNDDEDTSQNIVNVLGSKADMSFSITSFTIPRRSTIDADGKPHKLTIGVLNLVSTFSYTIVPKLSLHAYMKASTLNTSDKYLLTGPASIFMNNNFVAHGSIDNVCIGDIFDLPLGIDSGIKIEYKPVKKTSDTQGIISKTHLKTVRHETHITNTKTHEVAVYIYDQLPLSSDEKIKVNLIQPDLRRKDNNPHNTITLKDTNNLEWKCILPSRGECRLLFEYSVEWPYDKQVEFQEEL